MAREHWKTWMKIACISVTLLTASVADFTTECQRPCDCRWQSGNKAAICSNSTLKAIPGNLSSDIQILDLSNNHNLLELQSEAFKKVGLSNLKKLLLKDCNIEVVHKAAFTTLAIMIELDLSKNKIRHLHPDTFKGTEKLRLINLSNNLIDKLEDGLFRNLKYLQKVELSNNKIAKIGTKAFVNLPQLKILRFDGNNLSHMKPETLMALRNLSGLDLHNNLWRCDCNLQSFRDWVISHNLYTPPTSCAEPVAIRDKLWNELDSSSFACRPTILEPSPDSIIKSSDENVTLVCKVVGNPTPEVVWRYNGKDGKEWMIETKLYGELRYSVSENTMDLIRWVNLTIVNARYSDKGNYTCIAENPGGRDEKTLVLLLSKYGSGMIMGMDADLFAILIGCFTAIVIIFGVLLAVCYFSSPSNDLKRMMKSDMRPSNGEALIEGSVSSEMEKSHKTQVNPVTKPPRKYEAPSLTSEATEMSELNRTLLDNDSVLAPNEESNRLEVELPKISQEASLLDRFTQEHLAYPPDLLSFPLKGVQVSPASVTQDKTAVSSDSPKSPEYTVTTLDPRLYGKLQNTYENQGLISTKGYVTLPRKPRLPDTSIRPQIYSTLNGIMPYYESFNAKLFSHGGNYYSLNKSEIDLGPMHKVSSNFTDEEIEPAPSPAPGTPHATIPRSSLSSPNIHNQLLMLQAMSYRPKNSDQRPLRVMLSENERLVKNSLRDLRVGYNVSGNRIRTAPRPPPKPSKRNSSEFKEPFLLNSCDNATQV